MTRTMFAAWMSEITDYNTIGVFMLKRFGSKLDLLSVLSILSGVKLRVSHVIKEAKRQYVCGAIINATSTREIFR